MLYTYCPEKTWLGLGVEGARFQYLVVDWTLANQPYQAWLGLWWILDFPLRCGSVWWLPGGVPRQQWHVASRRVAIAATWRNKIEGSVETVQKS